MPNSYEHSYQHDLDNVIDASDAVLAIGTEKVDTTTLKDRSLTGNDATIYGAMPSNEYFLGRKFKAANENYLDCGNDQSLRIGTNDFISCIIVKYNSVQIDDYSLLCGAGTTGLNEWMIRIYTTSVEIYGDDGTIQCASTTNIKDDSIHSVCVVRIENTIYVIVDGVIENSITGVQNIDLNTASNYMICSNAATRKSNATILYNSLLIGGTYTTSNVINSFFNTLARLPLYSHNLERYPNSDTSLTSVFPYTSGIITSGSFNKTDGLKCTSAGQIVFSNSFEFDGSEYITLVINGVEYSGTTTVTQGTITATIAQDSNDITIDMGTGDVLPDIRVQFREEV